MAIAEHHPEKLKKKNRRVLSMSKRQLHEFAATKESRLPKRAKKKKSRTSRATAKLRRKGGKR